MLMVPLDVTCIYALTEQWTFKEKIGPKDTLVGDRVHSHAARLHTHIWTLASGPHPPKFGYQHKVYQ